MLRRVTRPLVAPLAQATTANFQKRGACTLSQKLAQIFDKKSESSPPSKSEVITFSRGTVTVLSQKELQARCDENFKRALDKASEKFKSTQESPKK